MFRSRRYRCILLVILGQASLAQVAGTIRGVVIDENGNPLPGAKVYPLEKRPFYGHRLSRFSETNTDGKFAVDHLSLGTYVVVAQKEGSGYPDARLAFYSNLEAPTVTLTNAKPNADVTIRLPSKAGWLDLEVTDGDSKHNVDSAEVTLRRVSNPNLFVSASATQKRVAVPSQGDITVEVTAPGFRKWPNSIQGESPYVVHLNPGEVYRLKVKLEPVAK